MLNLEGTFSSRADATRAARTAVWGDAPFARREFVSPKTRPDVAHYDERGLPVIAVAADVNGHGVVIHFDHYGRAEKVEVLT